MKFGPSSRFLRLVRAEAPAGQRDFFILQGDASAGEVETILIDPQAGYPQEYLRIRSSFQLDIYHFNDLHGHLVHYTPQGEVSVLSRFSETISRAHHQCREDPSRAVLALSSGDNSGGSIFDDMVFSAEDGFSSHPCYQLFSEIGLDAACLGNHDLDHGLRHLANAIQEAARFPVLTANIRWKADQSPGIFPGAVLIRNGLRIGLFGLVTQAETRLDPQTGVITDPIPVARNLISLLRPHCDLLIILSHLGYCLHSSVVPMADAGDVQLAEALPPGGVDLIIGGHTHTSLNRKDIEQKNVINGIPIVQAGQQGKYLGKVEMLIQEGSSAVKHARLIPVAELPCNPSFHQTFIEPLLDWSAKIKSEILGELEQSLDLSSEAVCEQFASGEVPLINYFCDLIDQRLKQHGYHADVVMLDASILQCGLPEKQHLTYGDFFSAMPFPDTLFLYELTGKQLLDLLLDNARRIRLPGDEAVDRGFLQFSHQIRYQIQLARNREQIQMLSATWRNIPLENLKEKRFFAAASSFTREIALNWEKRQPSVLFRLADFPFIDTGIVLRQEITAYIKDQGGISRDSGVRRDGRIAVISESNGQKGE